MQATAPMLNPTAQERVIETVKTFPGITCSEVHDLLPELSLSRCSSILSKLKTTGRVSTDYKPNERCGRGQPAQLMTFTWNEQPVRAIRRKQPTTDINTDFLRARIRELEAWKADAISRFPELGVDPIVLEARKMVIAQLSPAEKHLANEIRAGHNDETLVMRVAIEALSKA